MIERMLPLVLLLIASAFMAEDAWSRDIGGIVVDAVGMGSMVFWLVGYLIGWDKKEPR